MSGITGGTLALALQAPGASQVDPHRVGSERPSLFAHLLPDTPPSKPPATPTRPAGSAHEGYRTLATRLAEPADGWETAAWAVGGTVAGAAAGALLPWRAPAARVASAALGALALGLVAGRHGHDRATGLPEARAAIPRHTLPVRLLPGQETPSLLRSWDRSVDPAELRPVRASAGAFATVDGVALGEFRPTERVTGVDAGIAAALDQVARQVSRGEPVQPIAVVRDATLGVRRRSLAVATDSGYTGPHSAFTVGPLAGSPAPVRSQASSSPGPITSHHQALAAIVTADGVHRV
jgi:hypothetical protein